MPAFAACPVVFWDVFGEQGHPVRATVSDMGPLLLARVLDLNETQEGVLTLVFKVADDNGLLLLDLKDLRAMLQYVGDNAQQFQTNYGNVSAASIGAIQRGLLALEQQGAEKFIGEPMLNIDDLLQTGAGGKGRRQHPRRRQADVGAEALLDVAAVAARRALRAAAGSRRSRQAEARVLLRRGAPAVHRRAEERCSNRIEQVVRLIRSKGVGVYFVTQNPLDIPETVLGQLGNRVQHALRAFTPRDQKAVKAAADTLRAESRARRAEGRSPSSASARRWFRSSTRRAGRTSSSAPSSCRRGHASVPVTPDERKAVIAASARRGRLREDGRSRIGVRKAERPRGDLDGRRRRRPSGGGFMDSLKDSLGGLMSGSGRKDSMVEAMAKSAARTVGSTVGREIVRGVLGSLMGGRRR